MEKNVKGKKMTKNVQEIKHVLQNKYDFGTKKFILKK